MDTTIFLILAQDGFANALIYAMLGMALVLVFAVTRVIFIPQGELVAWAALTLCHLQAGQIPATLWVLLFLGMLTWGVEAIPLLSQRPDHWQMNLFKRALVWLLIPVMLVAVVMGLQGVVLPLMLQVLLAILIVVPMGPMLYRLVYQPVADASVLILLILSVALHFVMTGVGLLAFGPEGARSPEFWEASWTFGDITLKGQWVITLVVSLSLMGLLYLFFDKTLYGKALRAQAMNRTGARLMGISPELSGQLSFFLASLIGAVSGVLIAPTVTVVFDSGFLMGLKGFVAAIIGGLASYPATALGALLVGQLESFSSFWASHYKEIIVFTLIIPVLIVLSLKHPPIEEEV